MKTDKRDARTLAVALRLGAYRPAHRVSAARRHVRAELAVREALVRTRTRWIALAKALVRRDGLRVPSSTAAYVVERLTALPLSPTLAAELAPLIAVLEPLNVQIDAADARIAALGRTDPTVALLMTAPSIGPVTASGVVAITDDIGRFPSAHQFEAYLGLVPGGTEFRREAPTRAYHEGGQPPRALSPGRSGVAHPPRQVGRDCGAPCVGATHSAAPRQKDRGGRARGCPACDVAGRARLRRRPLADASARGGARRMSTE